MPRDRHTYRCVKDGNLFSAFREPPIPLCPECREAIEEEQIKRRREAAKLRKQQARQQASPHDVGMTA
jgi:hypothetical protein